MQSSRYSAKARLAPTCCGLPYPSAFAIFKNIFSVVGDDFTFLVSQLCGLVGAGGGVVKGEPVSTGVGEFEVVKHRKGTFCMKMGCCVVLRLRMSIDRATIVL